MQGGKRAGAGRPRIVRNGELLANITFRVPPSTLKAIREGAASRGMHPGLYLAAAVEYFQRDIEQ